MKLKLTHTRNSLPEKIRIEMTALLQERLSEGIDLMLQAKQAHWNVKGPSFIALHQLFDEVYGDAQGHVDLLAERIVQLGGMAQGGIGQSVKRSTLPEYPLGISSGKKHIAELAHGIAYFGEQIRKSVDLAAEHNDASSADLLTEILRGVDKSLWFVEAHEQSEQ